MAQRYATGDRIKETTTSTGTGDLVLAGAAVGFFAVSTSQRADGTTIQDQDFVSYVVEVPGGSDVEVGVGKWNSGANSLTRVQVKRSSNSNNLVNFAAGTKNIFLTVQSEQVIERLAIGVSPNNISGLMLRYSVRHGRVDVATDGFATKLYDISGNGRDSDTMTTTQRPKFMGRAFNRGYPCVKMDGVANQIPVTAMSAAGLGSPLACSFVAVVQSYVTGAGNRHLVNWRGNPIVFEGSGPAIFMFNGTSLSSVAAYNQMTANLTTDVNGHPSLLMAVFNGASSDLTMGATDVAIGNPGTNATGTTGLFTIGASSTSSDFAGFLLAEFAVYNKALSSGERQALRDYYRADLGIADV